MNILQFNLSKTSLISHRNMKVFMATHQNKSLVKLEDTAPEMLFSRMYIILLALLLKLLQLLLKKFTQHFFHVLVF